MFLYEVLASTDIMLQPGSGVSDERFKDLNTRSTDRNMAV